MRVTSDDWWWICIILNNRLVFIVLSKWLYYSSGNNDTIKEIPHFSLQCNDFQSNHFIPRLRKIFLLSHWAYRRLGSANAKHSIPGTTQISSAKPKNWSLPNSGDVVTIWSCGILRQVRRFNWWVSCLITEIFAAEIMCFVYLLFTRRLSTATP